MKVADFTIEHGDSSASSPRQTCWAYDHDDTAQAWQLIRRRGFGSYAEGPGRRNYVLEEYDCNVRERQIMDGMPHLEWCAWAAQELRTALNLDAGE